MGGSVKGTVDGTSVEVGTTVEFTAADATVDEATSVVVGGASAAGLEQETRRPTTANETKNARRLIILASRKDLKRSTRSDVRTLAKRLS